VAPSVRAVISDFAKSDEVVPRGGRAGTIDHRTEVTPDAAVRDSAPRGQEVAFNLK